MGHWEVPFSLSRQFLIKLSVFLIGQSFESCKLWNVAHSQSSNSPKLELFGTWYWPAPATLWSTRCATLETRRRLSRVRRVNCCVNCESVVVVVLFFFVCFSICFYLRVVAAFVASQRMASSITRFAGRRRAQRTALMSGGRGQAFALSDGLYYVALCERFADADRCNQVREASKQSEKRPERVNWFRVPGYPFRFFLFFLLPNWIVPLFVYAFFKRCFFFQYLFIYFYRKQLAWFQCYRFVSSIKCTD